MASKAAKDARKDAATNNGITKNWMAVLGTVAGGGLGAWGGSKIADSNFLGGLNGGTAKSSQEAASECVRYGEQYLASKQDSDSTVYLTKMLTSARKINTNKSIKGADKNQLKNAIDDLTGRMADANLASRNLANSSETYDCVVRVVKGKDDKTALSDCSSSATCNNESNCNATDGRKWYQNKCYAGAEVNAANGYSLIYQQDGVTENPSLNDLGKKLIYCKGNVDSSVVIAYGRNLSATKDDSLKIPHNYNTASNDSVDIQKANQELNKSVTTLIARCGNWDDDSAGQKTKSVSTAIGAGVGAVAGGVLAYQATKSVQDAKLNNVEKEAYNQWMNEVGQHINCVIGGDVVGQFGDVISTSME